MIDQFLDDLDQLRSRYEILGELGHDGEFVVYRARTPGTQRHVAIKLMADPGSRSTKSNALYGWQAHTVKSLDHPNLLPLHAVHHLQGGAVALAMERWNGRTLAERITRVGSLSLAEAERILRDVASALAYLHGRGVVHRGVRPQSIFIDPESGRATLAHFGIDKGDKDAPSLGAATSRLLRTFAYLAPEQIDGQEQVDGRALSIRSDIYSLGLLGYAMLTGDRPWPEADLGTLAERRKDEPLPPLQTVRPEIPGYLCRAIEGCLEARPRRRWRSTEDFLAQLEPDAGITRSAGLFDWAGIRARVEESVGGLGKVLDERWSGTGRRRIALGLSAAAAGLVAFAFVAGDEEPTPRLSEVTPATVTAVEPDDSPTSGAKSPSAAAVLIVPGEAAPPERSAPVAEPDRSVAAADQARRSAANEPRQRARSAAASPEPSPLLGDSVSGDGLVLLGEPIGG